MLKKYKQFCTALFVLFFACAVNAQQPPTEGFADLVEKLTPAVVNISTTQTIDASDEELNDAFSHNFPEGSPLQDLPELFKKFYGEDGNGGEHAERKGTSLGSGFVISPDGYIVTNQHVVEKADEITVIFSDDTKLTAKVIGKDTKTDLALIKVEPKKKLDFVSWGDSDKSRVGDWVIAIGNPFGLGGSVSAGIISARARDINAGPFDDFLQTDAAINRGNSGGPLFNIRGEVIGVNSAIFSPTGANVGIGFAVPSSLSEPVIKQLKENGYIKRGWLGVKIQTVTDEIAESLGLKEAKGALVLDVTQNSPAGKAGIQSGDIIVSFDGKELVAMKKLPKMVADTPLGKKVPVVIWRKGSKKTVVVTIAELKEDEEKVASAEEGFPENKKESFEPTKTILGLGIKDIDEEVRKHFSIGKDVKGVVVVKIDPESPVAQKPLRKGDVITAVGQEAIANVTDAEKLIKNAVDSKRKSVLLLINRGGDSLYIAVPVGK
jgi:serine protease Do